MMRIFLPICDCTRFVPEMPPKDSSKYSDRRGNGIRWEVNLFQIQRTNKVNGIARGWHMDMFYNRDYG